MLGSTVPTLFGFTTLDSSKQSSKRTRTGKYELDVVKAVLTFWPRLYGNLSTDEEHRVRERAQQAQVAVIAKAAEILDYYTKNLTVHVEQSEIQHPLKDQQQQDDQEELKNRETESPMTLEYNSDYELNEGDTLRMEDSDEDQESKTESSWHHNFKKLSRIINSDSDEADRTVTTRRNLIAESESESDQLAKQNQAIDAIGDEIDKTMSRLKSLVDWDSSSGRDQESNERSQAKEKKKDLLASLNLDFSDDSRSKASSSGGSDSVSRSGAARSDSGTENHDHKKESQD
ncbi:immunophilin FKBP46 [Culex quinquefasciatus]|uniref:Immunophilin FKBP46 n=1 Tax=Culex quinquefasciatus TaxID=7176 RepID=B0W7Q7_CULQU|nr:immunophilin FKBP46 [Culex quinquefasciatus]|eukprot:XP_001844741.1 immunophilin FKBP46 [Culex quinquefasciatus]